MPSITQKETSGRRKRGKTLGSRQAARMVTTKLIPKAVAVLIAVQSTLLRCGLFITPWSCTALKGQEHLILLELDRSLQTIQNQFTRRNRIIRYALTEPPRLWKPIANQELVAFHAGLPRVRTDENPAFIVYVLFS